MSHLHSWSAAQNQRLGETFSQRIFHSPKQLYLLHLQTQNVHLKFNAKAKTMSCSLLGTKFRITTCFFINLPKFSTSHVFLTQISEMLTMCHEDLEKRIKRNCMHNKAFFFCENLKRQFRPQSPILFCSTPRIRTLNPI